MKEKDNASDARKSVNVKSHNFKYTSRRRVRRSIVPPSVPKSERVFTPLQAQEIRRLTIDKIGYVSTAKKVEQQRMRSLKARRTLALKPAPTPPTAPKGKLAKETHKIAGVVAKHLSQLDYIFFFAAVAIAVIGIFAVHSATLSRSNPVKYDIMEIGCFVIGVGAMLGLSMVDYSGISRYTKYIIGINILLCIYTLIFGYSIIGDNNRNWINVFGIGVQPAEFSKVLFILSLSSHLQNLGDRINNFKGIVPLFCHGLLIISLVLLQGDLGNTTVFIAIFVFMCFAAKLSLWYFGAAVGITVIASPIIWQNLAVYQKNRILVGFNPDLDPLGKGYQVIRSRNAIASGGIFGKGYTKGYVTQHPRALFAKESDMIFGTIGEEGGLIACVALIVLFTVLIYRIIKISLTSKDSMGTYICAGVAGMFAYQFILNVGMCMGNLPVVGITLPLVSYGGSSLISCYAALALVLSVYANSNRYAFRKK